MEQVFFAHHKDRMAVEAVKSLLDLGCRAQIMTNGQTVPRECVAVFSLAKDANCGRNKAKVRMAAHRLQEFAPSWAQASWLPVGVRRLSKEALQYVARLRSFDPRQFDLNCMAPWGPVPRDVDNFSAYCDWIKRSLLLDPQSLGVHWQADVFNQHTRIKMERGLCSSEALGVNFGRRGYAASCVRGAGLCRKFDPENSVHRWHLTRIAEAIRQYILESTDNGCGNGLQLSSGLQTSALVKELLHAILSEKPVTIYIPTCPPWSYNETGYTFGRVCSGSRGICYDMMIKPMMGLIKFFRHLNIAVQPTLVIGDVEWFDLQDGAYSLDEPADEAEFMESIAEQSKLLAEDLVSRKVDNARVTTALSLCGKEEYLRLRSALQSAVREQVAESGSSTQRLLRNVIDLQRRLYARQCRMRFEEIDAADPPTAVREAAISDVVVYQALL